MVFAVRNNSVNSTAPTIALAMKLMSPELLELGLRQRGLGLRARLHR